MVEKVEVEGGAGGSEDKEGSGSGDKGKEVINNVEKEGKCVFESSEIENEKVMDVEKDTGDICFDKF